MYILYILFIIILCKLLLNKAVSVSNDLTSLSSLLYEESLAMAKALSANFLHCLGTSNYGQEADQRPGLC